MIGELEPDSGHGTFIAGLVRQACPDALILDVRLFGNTGVVAESELLRSLQLLALRQVLARNGATRPRAGRRRDDVARLLPRAAGGRGVRRPARTGPSACSGGTAPRSSSRPATTPRRGRSTRPRFAPYPGGAVADDAGRRPGDRGGRAQPGQHGGAVQQRRRLGAVPASRRRAGQHMPTTYDASLQPANAVQNTRGEWRAALDPDDFTLRVRGLERHVVRRPRLRRPAGGGAGRDGHGRPTRVDDGLWATGASRDTPARVPARRHAAARRGTAGEGVTMIEARRSGETLVRRAGEAFARFQERRPRSLRRARRDAHAAACGARAVVRGSMPSRPRTSSRRCG